MQCNINRLMAPIWLIAGVFVAEFPLIIGATVGYFASASQRVILADIMIPEAFEQSRDLSGLITVIGFLIAFILSKLLS